jgi:hypothetical protein
MRINLFKRFFGNYPATRENKLYVNLSKEDYDYFYSVFPEFGLGICLSTALMLVFLKRLRSEGIKDYDDRQHNDNFSSFDSIVTDVIGYKETQATPTESVEGGAKHLSRKKV